MISVSSFNFYYLLDTIFTLLKNTYFKHRKFAIDRPVGKQFSATHSSLTTHLRTLIQLYSERMQIFLSEYMYVIILRCVVQKLCVAKNCLPPGLSIANLRYL